MVEYEATNTDNQNNIEISLEIFRGYESESFSLPLLLLERPYWRTRRGRLMSNDFTDVFECVQLHCLHVGMTKSEARSMAFKVVDFLASLLDAWK